MPERSPLVLAALACAAVKGLEPVLTAQRPTPTPDLDIAWVRDGNGREWIVRSPRTPSAGVRLEAEGRMLEQLAQWLPYSVPQVEGRASLPEGGNAIVHRALEGEPVVTADLTGDHPVTAAIGRALASVHEVPQRLAEDAGLPVYTADEYRRRRLTELDRAAASGHVPPDLLSRWENALEEAGAWRFLPCLVHGDLAAENVLVDDKRVIGVLEWAETRVADPADDFAWLAYGTRPDVLPAVIEAYAATRGAEPDRDLPRRARLVSELSVAKWLLHGITLDDSGIVDEASQMLEDLRRTVATTPW